MGRLVNRVVRERHFSRHNRMDTCVEVCEEVADNHYIQRSLGWLRPHEHALLQRTDTDTGKAAETREMHALNPLDPSALVERQQSHLRVTSNRRQTWNIASNGYIGAHTDLQDVANIRRKGTV